MDGNMIILIGTAVILVSVCGSVFVIRRVRRQIAETLNYLASFQFEMPKVYCIYLF